MKVEKQEQILKCMSEVLNQNGFKAETMKAENVPMILHAEPPKQGKAQMDVTVECCFIPMPLPGGEDNGMLQFFVTLFQNAPKENFGHLRAACAYCNNFSAIGYFGLFDHAGQIFLKHNTLIDCSKDLQSIVTFFADNMSMVMSTVNRFIDGMASVGFSGVTLDAAVEQELFPKL